MARIRLQRRVLAGFALWASLWSLALPALEAHPIGAADDAACRLVFGSTNHETIRIVAPAVPGARPEHCDVCHLQRAVSGAFASDGAALTSPLTARCGTGLTERHPVAAVANTPSSRGPPVVLHN